MSDQQNLLDLLEEIKAVPEEKIIYCDVPYKVFIDEAEGLHTRADIDLPLLEKYNLTASKLDRLLVCTGALRTAQSNWASKLTDKQKAIEKWNIEAPELFNLRDEMLDHLEFALRNNEVALSKIKSIKEGQSKADAIQDLSDLAVLGKDNQEALVAINYDMALLDRASEMADHMGTLLGDINGRMYFEDELKLIRDQAYTLTKEVVDEIRSYGKFVFRNNPVKLRSYASKYNRERQAAYRSQLKAEKEESF